VKVSSERALLDTGALPAGDQRAVLSPPQRWSVTASALDA
jgi:hypothetical protein